MHKHLTEQCYQAAILGATKLVRLIQPNGKFIYAYDYTTGKISNKYNLTRHAGSLWAVLKVAQSDLNLYKEVLPSIIRSVDWLCDQHLSFQGKACAIVWKNQFKLGTNALTLLVVTELLKHNLNDSYRITAEGLAQCLTNWLVNQKLENEQDFIHKSILLNGKLQATGFISDYYLGECLLALLEWSNLSQDREMFTLAENVLLHLARIQYGLEFQSHWMMHTIRSYLEHPFVTDVSEDIKNYAIALFQAVIQDTSYRDRQESTPIACRTEGLLALIPYVKNSAEGWKHIKNNVQQQLTWLKPDGSVIKGNNNKVQIDYIQHNIYAWWSFAQQRKAVMI